MLSDEVHRTKAIHPARLTICVTAERSASHPVVDDPQEVAQEHAGEQDERSVRHTVEGDKVVIRA